MRFIPFFVVTSMCFLSACSYLKKPVTYIQNRDKHYLEARSIPPLHIPPGLSSDKFENYYPIPYRNYPNAMKAVSITPPGLPEKAT